MFAANVSASLWYCKHETLLTSIAQSITYMVQSVRSVHPVHIKSHDGHPLNEFADSICTSVSKHGVLVSMPSMPISIWEHAADLKWSFVALLDDKDQQQYHPIFRGDHGSDQLFQESWAALPDAVLAQPIDTPVDHAVRRNGSAYAWYVVSHNVRNISDCGVRDTLYKQYTKYKVHVAGLQETRARRSGVFCEGGYVVAASGPEK
eukprot:5259728-Karenia_brevis.AAC.1